MKKLITYIICFVAFINIHAQDNRFENGNTFFSEEKYEEAIEAYSEILDSGVESTEVYFNLGNAYYKTGKLPEAILSYERALLLSPNDKDVKYNLEMANMQVTDKLETVGEFILISWFEDFKNTNKSDSWAIISIIAFVLAALMIGFFFLSRSRAIKQFSFGMSILLVIVSVAAFNFAGAQKDRLTNRNTAIIFEPSVSIKSSPSAGGTDLFILHEGTKVEILEEVQGWNRIEISDGNDGWLPSSTIETI
ncbi:tetratricopeptide repeat protein [Labilibacter marinus]|uniref:tetratricopeptide repeat protein n=1 Tax=Labilibacter marinus TaxID=1477105 RepID=UPI00094FB570|nr:tetratricopeptide repeat protein [Labilibacter marinus]